MSDVERWAAALVLALAAHFFILQPSWGDVVSPSASGQMVLVQLSSSQVRVGNNPGLDILGAQQGDDESNIADERRKAYNRYLDEISAAIHARRFAYGRQDLIGVAKFSFIIGRDGTFAAIEMLSSSGRPELDKAAEYAVRSASGVVRRPQALGGENIAVIIPVKYQYDLN